LKAVSAKAISLTISNPGGNRFWIEQRPPGGVYTRTNHLSDAVNSTVNIDADTTIAVCFRLVLADTCHQANPSAEMCYTPPKQPDPLPVPDSTVFMPDAFSPNADGINDRFQLQGLLSGTAQLTVLCFLVIRFQHNCPTNVGQSASPVAEVKPVDSAVMQGRRIIGFVADVAFVIGQ
jgi:hypothetical protein